MTAAIKAANEATAAYQDAQSQYYSLQGQVDAARKKIGELQTKRSGLVKLARLRAVVAYKGGDLNIDQLVGFGSDIMESARRATLLDRVNARGNQAIAQLTVVTDELHAKEKDLDKQLGKSRASLADMKQQANDASNAVAEFANGRRSVEGAPRRAEAPGGARGAARGRAGRGAEPPADVEPRERQQRERWRVERWWGRPRADHRDGHLGLPRTRSALVHERLGRAARWRHSGSTRATTSSLRWVRATVAPTDGSMFFQPDPLGGLSWYVTDSHNNTYYGTHLSATVGSSRTVKAGELIGRVGNSGDAAGGPTHLHFEIRVGGPNGTRINPYPTLVAHCG